MRLTDKDEMPYGKHQGTLLANVDANYLIWMYDNNKLSQDLRRYVEANLDVLENETRRKEDD